jgi:hypothetical protein
VHRRAFFNGRLHQGAATTGLRPRRVFAALSVRAPHGYCGSRPGRQSMAVVSLASQIRSITETIGPLLRWRKEYRGSRGSTRPPKISECRPTTGSLTTANCPALREYGGAHGCNRIREGFHRGTEP